MHKRVAICAWMFAPHTVSGHNLSINALLSVSIASTIYSNFQLRPNQRVFQQDQILKINLCKNTALINWRWLFRSDRYIS